MPSGRWEIKDSVLGHEPSSTVEIAGTREGYIEGPGGVALDTELSASGFGPAMTFGAELELQTSADPIVFTCRLSHSGTANPVLELARDGAVMDAFTIPIALPPSVGAFVRLVVIQGGTELSVRCTIEGNLLPTTILAGTVMTTIPVQARPRLIASDVAVKWAHVTAHKLGR
jgi:hypothetical protein